MCDLIPHANLQQSIPLPAAKPWSMRSCLFRTNHILVIMFCDLPFLSPFSSSFFCLHHEHTESVTTVKRRSGAEANGRETFCTSKPPLRASDAEERVHSAQRGVKTNDWEGVRRTWESGEERSIQKTP